MQDPGPSPDGTGAASGNGALDVGGNGTSGIAANGVAAKGVAGNGTGSGRAADGLAAVGDGPDGLPISALAAPPQPGRNPRRIPEATVARLPVYLRSLLEVADAHTITISSERLAEMAGVNAAKVRKDLSYLGSYGTRGVGYDVQFLLLHINRVLGLTQDWPVVIVGIGNLGHALANYKGFSARGFRIAALVDADRAKVGEVVADLPVRHLDELPTIAAEEAIAIGIVATPAPSAQEVADLLVAAGVTSILNFAPAVISVPRGVSLRKVDLSIELQILSFYQQLRVVAPRVAEV
jgi:redox-sensing transcriptional repressor